MSHKNLNFIYDELKVVKDRCVTHVKNSELITCVPSMVRVHIRQTNWKQLVVCLQFLEGYPDTPVLIELKSKTLSDNFMEGLQKTSDNEAKKILGKQQVLPILKFIRNFIEDTSLCVCSEEIRYIKRQLLEDDDEIKLKQKTSQIVISLKKCAYFLKFKLTVPDNYPVDQTLVEIVDDNFPELLKKNFVNQAIEISRKCVQPPLKKKPKAPPFEPKPAVRPICEFLIKDCIKKFPEENCPICGKRALLENPQDMPVDRKDPRSIERVYCGHIFHHVCLDKYMKTPPFIGGKMCPGCGNRIYHDKWSATPELAEARWAHKEARSRELDEVVDFLQ